MLDIAKIRQDFPILNQKVYGKDLIYFDNGATTEKPIQVIEAIKDFYCTKNANIHRGVHYLSDTSTNAYENARKTVAHFIGASKKEEIVFTKGTTEAINLIANGFRRDILTKGDEVLVSQMEHHANIVPWQMACEETGAKLKVIPMTEKGELILSEYLKMLNSNVKIVALTHISNVLGSINPVKEIIAEAHKLNIPVLIDGAQSIQHTKIDVQDLDCDFYVFSGHKIYAPTGIGAMYGKMEWLEKLPPYQGGGDMIDQVTFEKTTYADVPLKFEAGTSNYVGAVALAKAMDYLSEIGIDNIANYEHELLIYATKKLSEIEGLRIIGQAEHKASVISFVLENAHHYDVGTILDKMGIAVRTGHHCAQPLMEFYKILGTIRASFAFYNTKQEIDTFVSALKRVKQMF